MPRGWILDLYSGSPGEMIVWLKLEDGHTVRLVDRWTPSIYVAADSVSDIAAPLDIVGPDITSARVVRKYESVTDSETSEVVEARLQDAKKTRQVAGRIERLGPYGTYRLYNSDIPPAQSYLYEHDLFPLAYCEVTQTNGELKWALLDDAWACDYAVPDVRKVAIDVVIAKQGKVARATDSIKAITLADGDEKTTIDGGSEADKLFGLVQAVRESDPDFVLTSDGDTFLFPYLSKRAEANGLRGRLTLDREGTALSPPSKSGTSYFSYGRIHYKPSATKLYGRLHIGTSTSFAYSEAGLDGLYELGRICRMPLQTASRASIGKALSSLQFYHASRMGLLVPWKPTLVEHLKDRNELLMADRGGYIFEPKAGVHEDVGELDFMALYPSIMLKKNISAETVRCPCCPDSKIRVPELDWNVCERRRGIVPISIQIIIEKRIAYKQIQNSNEAIDGRCNARQAALKWLGVTTFGYLGFSNAKFGRIDAHIAMCAWDRRILSDAVRVIERRGFRLVHGIVDSLWIQKPGADERAYMELKSEIESETGFEMSFEGIYKWMAFLPSKTDARSPVLNRYFGAKRDGTLKVRGIEARRHDTPPALASCQMEVLRTLARTDTAAEARAKASECLAIFFRYADAIERHEIRASDLAFAINLSKGFDEHSSMTIQHAAAAELVKEGVQLHAGEGIRYVISDYKGKGLARATPFDAMDDATRYDSERYVELLAATCASVIEPFDPRYTAGLLLSLYKAHKHLALS